MKRFVFTVLVFYLCLFAITAQTSLTNNNSQTDDRNRFYMRLGFGTTSFVGDGVREESNVSSKMSYDFMFGYQRQLGKFSSFKGILYWATELGLGQRGYKNVCDKEIFFRPLYPGENFPPFNQSYGVQKSPVEHYKLKAQSVKLVPIILGIKVNLGNASFAIDPHVGTFISYDYTGKLETVVEGEKSSEPIQDLSQTRKFDAGIQTGVCLWWKHINLDCTYQRGFVKYYDFGHFKIYSSHFLIRVGYMF